VTVGRSDWVRFPALVSCVLRPFGCGGGGEECRGKNLSGASLLHLFMTYDRLRLRPDLLTSKPIQSIRKAQILQSIKLSKL
jgi:hypothetical protein